MFELRDYIREYRNILSEDECRLMVKRTEPTEPATTITGVDRSIRNCYVKRIDDPESDKILFRCVGKILEEYSEEFNYLKSYSVDSSYNDTGYDMLKYVGSENGFYAEHVDNGFNVNSRKLSVSFILNEEYTGGQFSFSNNSYVVEPSTGSAVVFPSNFCFPHQILPVSNGNRYSVITWIT